MLLAEDLLLLLTDDKSGRLSPWASPVDAALGGALLAELALMGKVGLSGEADAGTAGRLVVRDPSPAGDVVLDAALRTVTAHQGKKPSAVVRPLSKNLRRTLYQRLADSGVVRAEHARIFGIVPDRTWPAMDTTHEAEVRRAITDALLGQGTPDARTAALIGMVHVLNCEHTVVDPAQYGLSKRQLRARAGEIADGDWPSQALRQAMAELAAVLASSASIVAALVTVAVSVAVAIGD